MQVEQFSEFTKPGVGETSISKRCKWYTGANHGITVSWICRSYVHLCILHTPPLLIQSETWPSQSKTRPSLSLLLPAHVFRSLSRSLTFSNHALAAGYSWSKRFQPSTTVLKAPGSGSLGTPHDVVTVKKISHPNHRQGCEKSLITIGNLLAASFHTMYVSSMRDRTVFKNIYKYI